MYRGRGRGRPTSAPRPLTKDDDGNTVTTQIPEGPPPLFPAKTLPPKPTDEQLAQLEPLSKSLSTIIGAIGKSPFNLGALEEKSKRAIAQEQLASVVTLDVQYFPRELFSEQQKSRGGSKEAQAAYWAAHHSNKDDAFDTTFGRIDKLVQRETTYTSMMGSTGQLDTLPQGDDGTPLVEDDLDPDGGFGEEDILDPEDNPYQQFDDDDDMDNDDDGHNENWF